MDLASIVSIIVKILAVLIAAAVTIATIAAGVQAGLQLLDRLRKPREEPPRSVPKPEKLLVPKFISRRDEQGHDLLEEVSEALKKAALVVIWGTGGVGKTTLAKEVANRLFESRYKGGVVWADADDVTDFGFISLLDKILDKLKRQDARTLALDDKKGLVIRLLGEEDSRLIVLDNFEAIAAKERRRIVPFLCALPCAALVASRSRIDRAENIHLPPMSDQEALDFLKMATRNTKFARNLSESQLEKVALAADRNPLLMQWVVGQVEEARALDEVLADIKAGKGKTSERIFDRSYKLLGPDGQSALLALALFVPNASRQALGVVAGFSQPGNWLQRLIGRRPGKTPVARLQQALEELATLALLEPHDDRLGLLRLTRELALTRLEKEGRSKELTERFILYFLAYAEGHPEVTKEDLDALDDELENLLAALAYAYVAEDWPTVMGLIEALEEFLDLRGYWDEAIKWEAQAVEVAHRAGDAKAVASFAHCMATMYQRRGGYQEAQAVYKRTFKMARNVGDQALIAMSLHQLGILAHDQGHYQEAKELYEQSLEIARNLGDEAGIASTLHQLAILAHDQGYYQQARSLYDRSLKTFEDLGAKREQAAVLHQLGMLAQHEGHYEQAKALYDQSLKTVKELGAKREQASVFHQLGMLAQHEGHCEQAKALYDQSLQIKRSLGDQAGIALSLHQLGNLAEETGQVEEAAQLYREALAIFERIGSRYAYMASRDLARVTGEEAKE